VLSLRHSLPTYQRLNMTLRTTDGDFTHPRKVSGPEPHEPNPMSLHKTQNDSGTFRCSQKHQASLQVLGHVLGLGIVAMFTASAATGPRRHQWRSGGADWWHRPMRAAKAGTVIRHQPDTTASPRRYLDTEYWVAFGGDPLAIDVLLRTTPASQP